MIKINNKFNIELLQINVCASAFGLNIKIVFKSDGLYEYESYKL